MFCIRHFLQPLADYRHRFDLNDTTDTFTADEEPKGIECDEDNDNINDTTATKDADEELSDGRGPAFALDQLVPKDFERTEDNPLDVVYDTIADLSHPQIDGWVDWAHVVRLAGQRSLTTKMVQDAVETWETSRILVRNKEQTLVNILEPLA